MKQKSGPSSTWKILKHADLAMFAICILCFIAAERIGVVPWAGLAFAALGLGGLIRGLIIIVERHDEEVDGESGVQATRSGVAAVLYGLHFVIAGLLGILLGTIVALGWEAGTWVRTHWWVLAGVGGIWLAIVGATTMLGTEEGKPESMLDFLLQTPGRTIGVIIMLFGIAVAVCGFGQINPLRFL